MSIDQPSDVAFMHMKTLKSEQGIDTNNSKPIIS